MAFLDPTKLFLLGLLVLVVAAYILRMPRRRLRVPDALIARLALADRSRISRERRTLISLALQVAILVLLVAAAALPFLGDRREGNRLIVVLLDVSASMQADPDFTGTKFRMLSDAETVPAASVTRFARALDAIRGLARDMRPGDRMMLMAVGRTVDVVFNFRSDQDFIARALDGLSPSAEEANFADASRLAAEIVESRTSAEVFLVTDAAVRSTDLAPLAQLKPASVKLVNVGERSGNLGITNFRVRRNLDSPTDYEALVSLINTFDEVREVEVQLLLNGAVFDIAKVTVSAGGETVHVFREKLHVGGVLEARLRVVDALAEDNVAWEVLRPPTRLRVLLVSDDTSASSFLVRAVGSNASAVEGMILTPEQYRETIAPNPSALRGQRDAVIFDRWVPSKPEELPPTHLLTVDCVPPGMPVAAGEPFDKPLIRKWEHGHPLMSYLNLRNVFISSARRVTLAEPKKGEPPVERVAEMVTSPLVLAWEREMPNGAHEARTANGLPLRPHPQRFVVIAFDPRQSDIVLRKELPLLLWNSLLWFQSAGEPATQVAPGETFALNADESRDAGRITVITPAGRVETVVVGPESPDGTAFFANTSQAGVYRYRIGKKEDAFTVNTGRRIESDVRPAEDLGFKPEVVNASDLAAIRPVGRALWPYLLLAAALLLAVEAVLFHRRVYF